MVSNQLHPTAIPTDTRIEAFSRLKSSGFRLEDEDWSEADTRSKLIDCILKESLGWQEDDIRRELSTDKKRLDYRLSTVNPVVIVEAKRADLPLPTTKRLPHKRVSLSALLKAVPALQEHVFQVVEYCRNWSTQFAVLTNGTTYIVFAGCRTDGKKLEQGDAIVFDILHDAFQFPALAELLCREAVASGSLERELLGDRQTPKAKSVLQMLDDPDAPVPPNPLADMLDPILTQVFADAVDDQSDEVIQHCYVKPAEGRLIDDTLEYALLDRPPTDTRTTIDLASLNAFERFELQLKLTDFRPPGVFRGGGSRFAHDSPWPLL
jgi:hypothetical protein